LKKEAKGSSVTVVFNYHTTRREIAGSDLPVYTHSKIDYIQFPELQPESFSCRTTETRAREAVLESIRSVMCCYHFRTAAYMSDKWSNMFNFERRNGVLVSQTANKRHFSAEINNSTHAEM
jgi:hypothetical protein